LCSEVQCTLFAMVGEMVQNSQSLYSFTLNAFIIIHEYIYSHSTAKFIFKKYINSHLTTYFLFTNTFTRIYRMHYLSTCLFSHLSDFDHTQESGSNASRSAARQELFLLQEKTNSRPWTGEWDLDWVFTLRALVNPRQTEFIALFYSWSWRYFKRRQIHSYHATCATLYTIRTGTGNMYCVKSYLRYVHTGPVQMDPIQKPFMQNLLSVLSVRVQAGPFLIISRELGLVWTHEQVILDRNHLWPIQCEHSFSFSSSEGKEREPCFRI